MNTITGHGHPAEECCKHAETEQVCGVMEKCCSHMSADEKKEMMSELMPRMSKIAGGDSPAAMMGVMMNSCMRVMRWMPLVPLTFGIVLFALGYFLSPEVVRVLWLIIAGLITTIGIVGLILTTMWSHTHKNIAA